MAETIGSDLNNLKRMLNHAGVEYDYSESLLESRVDGCSIAWWANHVRIEFQFDKDGRCSRIYGDDQA